MRELKIGDIVKYVGETTDYFIRDEEYEIISECFYSKREYRINIINAKEEEHCLTEEYFNNYFIIL